MASSNKVVLIKTDALAETQNVVKVFENRKVLTSWLSKNVDLTDGNGDKITETLLRDDVNSSFQDGTPLRFNPNYAVVKWLAGTKEGSVLVRKILRLDDNGLSALVSSSNISLDPWVPTSFVSSEALAEAFKLNKEKLERARVVTSVAPSGKATEIGFLVGDIILHANGRKTSIFLASETAPHHVDYRSIDQEVVYVGRSISQPVKMVKKDPATASFSSCESNADFVADVAGHDEKQGNPVNKDIKKKAAKAPSKSTINPFQNAKGSKVEEEDELEKPPQFVATTSGNEISKTPAKATVAPVAPTPNTIEVVHALLNLSADKAEKTVPKKTGNAKKNGKTKTAPKSTVPKDVKTVSDGGNKPEIATKEAVIGRGKNGATVGKEIAVSSNSGTKQDGLADSVDDKKAVAGKNGDTAGAEIKKSGDGGAKQDGLADSGDEKGPDGRFGWASNKKAPANDIVGTALMQKRSNSRLPTSVLRPKVGDAKPNQVEINSSLAAAMEDLSLGDENSKPEKEHVVKLEPKTRTWMKNRIREIEDEASMLKKQLAEMEKTDG